MVPESTLEELESANAAAQECLVLVEVIGADVERRIRRGEVGADHFAGANRTWATELLESWRWLSAALKPHVQRDFTAVCSAPVEIGMVIAPNAHFAAWSVSHMALIHLSIVMHSEGYWPSSQPETDLLLLDFDGIEVVDDSASAAVQALGTVFDQLGLREIRNCRAIVYREFVAARAQLPAAAKPPKVANARGKTSDPNRRELNRLAFWTAIRNGHFDEEGKCIRTDPYTNKELTDLGMTGNPSEMFRLHLKDLITIECSKPRDLYQSFCKRLLGTKPDKVYTYLLQQLNEKLSAYREKQASSHTLDGRGAAWKELQDEVDERLDRESND